MIFYSSAMFLVALFVPLTLQSGMRQHPDCYTNTRLEKLELIRSSIAPLDVLSLDVDLLGDPVCEKDVKKTESDLNT